MPNLPSPLNPPTLRSDLPNYPPLMQLVRVTAEVVAGPADVGLYYAAFTQQRQAVSGVPRDREPCLAQDVNGNGLEPGFHLGRLSGSHNALPVYTVVAIPGPAGPEGPPGIGADPDANETIEGDWTFNGLALFAALVTLTGGLTVSGTIALNGVVKLGLTHVAWNAHVIDYDLPTTPVATAFLIVDVEADIDLVSIKNGSGGRFLFIVNKNNAFTLTLGHEHVTAGDDSYKMRLPGGADYLLGPGQGVGLVYSDTDDRWYCLDKADAAAVLTQMSITADGSGLKLVGDAATPGNSKYYGTDAAGAKGFHALPGAGSSTFSGARVYRSTVQSIPHITLTTVLFDVESFDTDSYHSTVTDTGRLTAPSTGYYLVGGQVEFAANTGNLGLYIYLNGNHKANVADVGAAGLAHNLQVTSLLFLAAGDYVELKVTQTSGASVNINTTADARPVFWITRLGS